VVIWPFIRINSPTKQSQLTSFCRGDDDGGDDGDGGGGASYDGDDDASCDGPLAFSRPALEPEFVPWPCQSDRLIGPPSLKEF
jgi:hypothetical protein